MTQEEKARRYDEALERARKCLDEKRETCLVRPDVIFPELAESEDEKVIKTLIELVKCNERSGYTLLNNVSTSSMLTWLEKQGEQKEYTFKSIPRLLDMIEPSNRAKAYCQKLIDTLAKEGYNTDAKIVEEVLKKMNGDDVPMAIMDEQKPFDYENVNIQQKDLHLPDEENATEPK